MVLPMSRSTQTASTPRFGPAVGEPPPWIDPRRWGSLIGLLGGMVFIAGYSPPLGSATEITAWMIGLGLVGAALFTHYVRPVVLGVLARPSPAALAVYAACVVGELALINIGSRALAATSHSDLRPALIAAVVGLHFIPFAWAFGERMFIWLGTLVATIGTTGMLIGYLGINHAADAAAVTAGLTMHILILLYAQGRFAHDTTAT